MTRARLAVAAVAAVLALVLASGVGAAWSWRALNAPLDLPEGGLMYTVQNGAAFSTVMAELADLGATEHPRLISWYSRARGTATRIHAGEYRLEAGLTALTLLEKLNRGDVFLHQFTIIEGWRFADMLAELRRHPAILAGADSGEIIMAALGRPELHPEGQFLPDTYSFPRGTRDIELLRWAHSALQSTLDEAWSGRTDPGTLQSAYEGLILASIIEKETALGSERGLISGVMHERLRRRMRLQTDPTVIYGLGAGFDGNLTRADIDRDTPYNTYTRGGLPPTPIALAGSASIAAAFAPAETDALYFVATGDPDGSHVFSRTLEEHNAAVARYVERQRSGQ
jgi:UPF0755 protein